MNILFITISTLPHMSQHSISLDLLREMKKNGHKIYVVCANERKNNTPTTISNEDDCVVLRVKTGNNKKANLIEKGITTIMLPRLFISAIKKYFADVKFDMVLYPTPPITHVDTVKFIKKRDNAKSYLLLKDIFPQNAVDIGMMSKTGLKGILYRYFRKKEKKLYALSDKIGCMSQANCDYILKHNPEIPADKVEICPNCIEYRDLRVSDAERNALREKYGLPLDKKIFIYGGNLGKPQGIPFIIDCLKAQEGQKDAIFVIVGDGTEYKKLEAYVEEYKPAHVKLMKRLPKEDYDRMLAACDVGLIFLDYRFTIPNFPSRLLTYMQVGLPVLACTDPNTDIGKVVVEGGFGWWCESNDVEKFGRYVDCILHENYEQYSQNALTYLMNFYQSSDAYRIITKS